MAMCDGYSNGDEGDSDGDGDGVGDGVGDDKLRHVENWTISTNLF